MTQTTRHDTLLNFEQRLPWCDPLLAFESLATDAYALLLYDGQNQRGRVYAFPERIWSGSGRACFESLAKDHRSQGRNTVTAGLFGYDLAAAFEELPPMASDWPEIAIARYSAWAEFDRAGDTLVIQGASLQSVERLQTALKTAGPSEPEDASGHVLWAARWSREQYLSKAKQARDYVHAGDVFQVNLSQAFDVQLRQDDRPYDVFRRLAQISSAPHAAYFCLGPDRVVMSNSPERFLSSSDRKIESRPIKGTRPRHSNPELDAVLANELAESPKDKAENLMSVDLMRNDLSRVCVPGSVFVSSLCDLESYANVHHLVSSVEGELDPDKDVFDLIEVTFPPGSITGAPKVRAMEIIAELEDGNRGPYCGAIGWISHNGDMDLNVMIRTVTLEKQDNAWQAVVRSGGGIVADSVPEEEYEETLTKVSALRCALEGNNESLA
jgi:para-aminobenzoate synthetase component 1